MNPIKQSIIKQTKIKLSMLFLSMALMTTSPASAESISDIKEKAAETISFFMTVEPGEKSLQSSAPVHIGEKEVPFKDFMSYLHKGRTLVVKTISIENKSLPIPATDAYSVIVFGHCDINDLSIGGFGNSAIATYGLQSNTVNIQPGLVATVPQPDHNLCVSSYVQSTETARVFIHGILL